MIKRARARWQTMDPEQQQQQPGAIDVAFDDAIRTAPKQPSLFKKFLFSSVGFSLATSIIVVLLLLILNPPMVRKRNSGKQKTTPLQQDSFETCKPDLLKAVFWGLGAGLLVFCGPFVYSWIAAKLRSEPQD
jgi:hypothetical protein